MAAPARVDATVAASLSGVPWRVDPTRIVWGGVRFEVRDDDVAVAGGVAAPIVAATQVDDAWLFLTEDGLLARAADFLGPLEVVERWENRAAAVEARERIVIAGGQELWTSTGGPFERVAAPGVVEDGAFRADVGLVLAGGALHATGDGGRSWSPVDVGAALPLDVALSPEGAFAVMRTDGPYRWRDGSWERARFPSEERAVVPEAERLALLRAAAALPWMRIDADFLAELEEQAEQVQEGCVEAAFAGHHTFARCARGDERWWERRVGSDVVRIEVVTGDPPLVSTDGRTALWMSPCTSTTELETACALVGDRRLGVALDDETRVVAVGAGLALTEQLDAQAPWERVHLLDLRSGRATLVRFGSEARALLDAPTVELDGAWIQDDGRYVALSLRRESSLSGQLVLAAGDPAAGLRVRPLPIGAAHVAVLSDGRAVVFGDGDANDHWAPRGGSFRRLHVAFDGAVLRDPEEPPTCDETSCRAGSLVISTNPGQRALLGGGGYVSGARTSRVRVIVFDELDVSRRLECDDPFSIAPAGPDELLSMQPGARARLEIEGGLERWTWEPAGATARTAIGAAPEPTRQDLTLVHATPLYALLLRCHERSCAAQILRQGRVESVPAPPLHPELASVPLDDGGLLVVVRTTYGRRDVPVDIGWWIDVTGRLSRTIARPGPLMLARWGGYGWIAPDAGELVFVGLDGTERRFAHSSEEPRPCRAALARDALLVRDTMPSVLNRGDQQLAAYPWLELAAESACIRGYDVYPAAPSTAWPSRIEAHDGRLRTIERGRRGGECRERY